MLMWFLILYDILLSKYGQYSAQPNAVQTVFINGLLGVSLLSVPLSPSHSVS